MGDTYVGNKRCVNVIFIARANKLAVILDDYKTKTRNEVERYKVIDSEICFVRL